MKKYERTAADNKNGKQNTGKKFRLISPLLLAVALALLAAGPALAADGWQQNGSGQWVYLQNEKKTVNQWVLWPDGTWRFVDGSGLIAVNRWINFEDKRYYVREDGTRYENAWFSIDSVPKNPLTKVTTTWYYAGADGAILKDGWYSIEGKKYYFYAGGNSPKKAFITLDDKRYYVDENGARQENGWFSISGTNGNGVPYTNWYYADSDGAILKDGWHELNGNYYYFYPGCNSPRKSWVNLDQDRYYVDENGVRQQDGWFAIRGVNGNGQEYENWYYARPDGVILRNGFAELDGNSYYFDVNGLSYRKRWYVDGQGSRYYLDENGVLQKNGWFKISTTNTNTGVVTDNWYLAAEDGSVSKGGYREVDGKTYYFDANGTMYKKRWLTTEKGGRQYFGEDGVLYQNAWFGIDGTRADGTSYTNWYHADEKGNMQKNGWHTIDGKEYYLNSGGNMATKWFDDKKYYLGEDGARRYGWQWLEIEDDWIDDNDRVADHFEKFGKYAWFYFSETSGRKRECTSGTYNESRIGGVNYIFDTYGIMQRGWIRIKGMTPAIKGFRYLYPEAGEGYVIGQLAEHAWVKTVQPDELDGSSRESWYYFKGSGEPVCAAAGKYTIEKIDGKRYAFDSQGHARTGLLEIDDEVYYFGPKDGDMAGVEGACEILEPETGKKAKYRFASSGKGITGIEDGYFYYKGKLQTAAKGAKYEVFNVPGKGLRLISESGKMVKDKKVKDGAGCQWKTGSGGKILEFGSDDVAEIEAPETEEYEE